MTVNVTGFRAEAAGKTLVADVDFTVDAGRILAIVGASGSGKTTIGSALLGAVKRGVEVQGVVEVAGVDVLHCAPGDVPAAYLPQHPAAVLNPVRRIGGVLREIAKARRGGGGEAVPPDRAVGSAPSGARVGSAAVDAGPAAVEAAQGAAEVGPTVAGAGFVAVDVGPAVAGAGPAVAGPAGAGARRACPFPPASASDQPKRTTLPHGSDNRPFSQVDRITDPDPDPDPDADAGAAERLADVPRPSAEERIADAMRRAGLDDPAYLRRFPHQLSGGQQQRLVLAQAFLCEARLLVADEPTTGQDLGNRDRIAAELRVAAANGMAVVLLSHDLELVESVADELLVLEGGRVVERGSAAQVLTDPQHDYTRRLLAARGVEPATAAGAEAPIRVDGLVARGVEPALAASAEAPIRIEGRGLRVVLGSRRARILDDVDFQARQGECLAVLGESGSGKTTLARTVAGLQQAAAGTLHLDGEPLPVRGRRRSRAERARVQYVFQDARASFDEHRSIAAQVARSAVRLRGLTADQARDAAAQALAEVGLTAEAADRRRDKLSGGQLQRAALARALAAAPEVLVCDEITSGLDALTRKGVLDLLAALKTKGGLTILLITHEPAVAARLADRVLRIKDGTAVVD